MDVVNTQSGVFPQGTGSRETVGAELRPANVASPDLAAVDTQNPPVDGSVSISQPPKYEVTPPTTDGVGTIAGQPKYEITPGSANAATQGVDLGAPVTIDNAAQMAPIAQETDSDSTTTNDISHLDAVGNSLDRGKHGSLEDMVSQPPGAPVLEEKNENIGDVSMADAISPDTSVAQPPPTAEQPSAPIATPVAEPTAEAVPPPFVVTPEDDGEQQVGDLAAVPTDNPAVVPDPQSAETPVSDPTNINSQTIATPEPAVQQAASPEPIWAPPATPQPVQPTSALQQPEPVSETPAYTPTPPIATEPVNPAPATMETPSTAEAKEIRQGILDLFDQRIGALRAELEEKMGGPAEEEKSKGEI